MIVRITFLLGLFLFTSACSTGQKNNSNEVDALNTPLTTVQKETYANQIKFKYDSLFGKNFQGQILVAKNGQIVFEDYKGYENMANKTPITAQTPIHLASISKTFTAMSVLKLWEQKQIDLKDPVTKYLPKFPYTSVNIEQLLSHRSGLPDYTYLMDPPKYITVKTKTKRGKWVSKLKLDPNAKNYKESNYNNQDVLDFLVDKRPAPQANPDKVFKYCNTNYVILALIVEKITGKDFPTHIQETIFKPLKMDHSYVFSAAQKDNYLPSYTDKSIPYKIEKYDFIYGDKNIYSTVNDLLLWDKALRSYTYLAKATLDMAYTGKSPVTKDFHNYGYGWRMIEAPNEDRLIYHNGWWHGNNTVFTRLMKDNATIIILGNKYNKNIYKGKHLGSVFTGKEDSTSTEQ
jgi:CubicO group peptidase (beta-lactamase class C family)